MKKIHEKDNKINVLYSLKTFFFILWCCLNNKKRSFNELLIDQILWALEQEFSHYDMTTLLKHFNEYLNSKKTSVTTKVRLEMKFFIINCCTIKPIDQHENIIETENPTAQSA